MTARQNVHIAEVRDCLVVRECAGSAIKTK